MDTNEKAVSAVINYIKYNAGVQRDFYSKIIILIKLYLLSPSMNGVSEKPASLMCRIKNWLRSTMPQKGLNYCMLLSIHTEKLME